MNQFIVKVINESRVEQLPHVSLEEEMALTFAAESYRHELEVNLNDISRTLDLTEALEGLAIVASEITEPTPAQAALMQIGGDMAVAGSDMDGSEITPSMEDIKETGAAISFQVKRAIEAVIRAIKELLAKIGGVVRKYLQAIRASVGGHVQRLKVIKERLAAANFSMNTNEDFTMAMPVVGDHLITNLSQVLKEAAVFNVNIDSFIRYASDFNINYASGMTDLYSKLGGKGLDVVEQFNLVSKISDSVFRVSGRATTSSHVAPNLDYFDVKKFTSQDLLGGVSIVQTTALIKADPNDLSSASIRHAIEELTSHVGIKVVVKHLGFGQEDCSVKPFTKSEMEQAVKVVEALLEHFTGKSEHSSLSIAATRRLEFAETAVEHITRYIEKFDKNSISAKEYSNAALKVTNSIIQNATQPYSMLTTALNRCITLLTNAMLKSLNAHELYHRQTQFNKDHSESMQQKTKPSNESITDLVYSEEGILGDLFKGLFSKKPKKLNLTEKNDWKRLDEIKQKIKENYIDGVHEVSQGEIDGSFIIPYLFGPSQSHDPEKIHNYLNESLNYMGQYLNAASATYTAAGQDIFKAFKTLDQSNITEESFEAMQKLLGAAIARHKGPPPFNPKGSFVNFDLDKISKIGGSEIDGTATQDIWDLSDMKPEVKRKYIDAKLPKLTSPQVKILGQSLYDVVDFMLKHNERKLTSAKDVHWGMDYGHDDSAVVEEWVDKNGGDDGPFSDMMSSGDQYYSKSYTMIWISLEVVQNIAIALDRWISGSVTSKPIKKI